VVVVIVVVVVVVVMVMVVVVVVIMVMTLVVRVVGGDFFNMSGHLCHGENDASEPKLSESRDAHPFKMNRFAGMHAMSRARDCCGYKDVLTLTFGAENATGSELDVSNGEQSPSCLALMWLIWLNPLP